MYSNIASKNIISWEKCMGNGSPVSLIRGPLQQVNPQTITMTYENPVTGISRLMTVSVPGSNVISIFNDTIIALNVLVGTGGLIPVTVTLDLPFAGKVVHNTADYDSGQEAIRNFIQGDPDQFPASFTKFAPNSFIVTNGGEASGPFIWYSASGTDYSFDTVRNNNQLGCFWSWDFFEQEKINRIFCKDIAQDTVATQDHEFLSGDDFVGTFEGPLLPCYGTKGTVATKDTRLSPPANEYTIGYGNHSYSVYIEQGTARINGALRPQGYTLSYDASHNFYEVYPQLEITEITGIVHVSEVL